MAAIFGNSKIIDGSKNVYPAENLSGKVVGIYFSAHWCPPCRGFTPHLAKKYNELKAEGKNFEIVFVSSDRSAEDASSYFSEMPWKMLDYSERDKKGELSQKFRVQGIPTLILLDETGDLITDDGRTALMTMSFDSMKAELAEKQAAKKAVVKPSSLFKGKLFGHHGAEYDSSGLDGKMVMLYFSAHWCPPCRGFTPQLAKKYKEIVDAGHKLEIIFLSGDESNEEAQEYFESMPWVMLNFEDRDLNNLLSEKYDVEGIPTLVVLSEEGKLITTEGREAIMTLPFDKIPNFDAEIGPLREAARIKREAELADEAAKTIALIATLPEEIKVPSHDHPLKKTKDVYRGRYGCDVCSDGGACPWVYHCDECGYDAHPKCAAKFAAA